MKMQPSRIQLFGIVFVVISILLGMFSVQLSAAQPLFHHRSKSMLRMDGQDLCLRLSQLGLTDAQRKALKDLLQAYTSEALPLRIKLMSARFELLHLIRDPNVQPKILLDRQKKISEFQADLNCLFLSYLIKTRSIMTKEQLEQLYKDYSVLQGLGLE